MFFTGSEGLLVLGSRDSPFRYRVGLHAEVSWDFAGNDFWCIKGPTGLFVSFPAKKQRDGSYRQLAYPANAETRMIFQRVILAEYEKIVGKENPLPTVRSASERRKTLEQLKTDGREGSDLVLCKRAWLIGSGDGF
jgi:stage V sporulation protein G